MTERLYYQDADCLVFTARVASQRADSGRWRVVLDRTAFFPEGGGHPFDRGTLEGIPVLDVQDLDGEVVHFLGKPLPGPAGDSEEGRQVTGQVDPEHRREYREQHTGQHIVSASLEEAAAASTLSAHLGERCVTVEVDRDALGEDELLAAESLANRIVTANLPVRVHWAERDELPRYPLRRPPPAGIETLRIVEIPGYDATPCGGLHVRSTGEVGLIQLVGTERIRRRLRLSWRIGERAYREARATERLAQELAHELGCKREELAAAVRELKERLRARDQETTRLRRRVAGLLAPTLRERARRIGPGGPGGFTLVLERLEDCDSELLEELIRTLVAAPSTVVALVCLDRDELRWVAGASPQLELDLGSLILPNLGLIAGRGGGRGNRWQGVGGNPGGADAFLGAVHAAVHAAVQQRTPAGAERETEES
ncbi:MAG: hypothetical protein JW820_09830 [Spirochaetales bacterium]|nr:hypothetical protein [Spirochaetales bacterium]